MTVMDWHGATSIVFQKSDTPDQTAGNGRSGLAERSKKSVSVWRKQQLPQKPRRQLQRQLPEVMCRMVPETTLQLLKLKLVQLFQMHPQRLRGILNLESQERGEAEAGNVLPSMNRREPSYSALFWAACASEAAEVMP